VQPARQVPRAPLGAQPLQSAGSRVARVRPRGRARELQIHRQGATATEDATPRGWSRKDERQYEHVKQSSRKRGVSEDRASEIAARTVNRQRRREGRTPNASSQGTGNPNAPLEDRTKRELYNLARKRGIDERSKMSKQELIGALRG